LSPSLIADRVFERCFLGNAVVLSVDLPAGITETIGNLIMYLSGDCDTLTLKQDIDVARMLHPKDTVYEYMRAVIVSIFPYKIEDIENWCRPQFIRNFAIAENIFSKQNPEYELLSLADIKSAEELAQAEKQETSIDFERENRAIRKTMSPFDTEEAESGKLSRGQLKKLSAASRG
jgi:hypothetical protein